jgi:hypothetical protein
VATFCRRQCDAEHIDGSFVEHAASGVVGVILRRGFIELGCSSSLQSRRGHFQARRP